MELRHIRYFLAVAEEGNFTRAAARLGIGQPPLSQQIRDLEEEVGARLFHRVPHGAELTEAGSAFLAGVRSMPDQAASATRSARRAARGETGALRLGFTGSATLHPIVPGSIRAFRRSYAEVELSLVESSTVGLATGLRDGSLDIAFLRPRTIDSSDLHFEPLPDEPMIAALPAGHRLLATGDETVPIRLADLSEDAFVMTPRAIGPTFFDATMAACAAAGFTPRLGQAAPQIVSVLALVAAELGVSVVPDSMRQLTLPGVAYRDIADAAPVARLALAYLRASRSPLVRNFVAEARRV